MVVSVLVNAAAEVAVAPLLPSILNFNRLSPAELERLIVGGLLVFGITVVGGFVGSVYAGVWAVVATAGPIPTTNDVLRLAARRLLAIVGTGIVVVLISLAVVLPGSVPWRSAPRCIR